MGVCGTNKIKKEPVISQMIPKHADHTLNYNEINYKDMPEWGLDKFKGEGIKKMKAYKCDLPIDELNKLRDAFWNFSIQINPVWKHIRQACAMDDVRAANIVASHGLKPQNGCINLLKDCKGKFYKVPNYCINDPYFEKIIMQEDTNKDINKTPTTIKFYMYNLYQNKKCEIEVLDTITGAELKDLYCSFNNVNISDYNIRIFFGGAEIINEHKLYKHNIKNNFTLQVFMNEKEKL